MKFDNEDLQSKYNNLKGVLKQKDNELDEIQSELLKTINSLSNSLITASKVIKIKDLELCKKGTLIKDTKEIINKQDEKIFCLKAKISNQQVENQKEMEEIKIANHNDLIHVKSTGNIHMLATVASVFNHIENDNTKINELEKSCSESTQVDKLIDQENILIDKLESEKGKNYKILRNGKVIYFD